METSKASYIFYLPFNIEIGEMNPYDNIETVVGDGKYNIIIEPPKAEYVEGGERIDGTEIKIDVEVKDGVAETEDMYVIVSEQLRRVLTYCRFETGQYHINPRIDGYCTIETRERGKQSRSFMLGRFPSEWLTKEKELDEISWVEVRRRFEQDWSMPMTDEMLFEAKLYESQNDYRMAVVSSAIGIESSSKRYIRKKMEGHAAKDRNLSKSQIDSFVDGVSNKQTLSVLMAIESNVNHDILKKCQSTIEVRNAIVHHGKKKVTRDEARDAILGLEGLSMSLKSQNE